MAYFIDFHTPSGTTVSLEPAVVTCIEEAPEGGTRLYLSSGSGVEVVVREDIATVRQQIEAAMRARLAGGLAGLAGLVP
jgi:uncharacterized protein YlzI (FlbEa/FlbD family)